MGLSDKKEDQLRKMPIVQTRIFKSKNGNFLVHKTIITDIKPLEYYKAVFDGTAQAEEAQELEV